METIITTITKSYNHNVHQISPTISMSVQFINHNYSPSTQISPST